MAYPTEPTESLVVIATDANHADPGEAWDGQPTKVSPSVGLQATGFTPATPVPPGVFNYMFNTLTKWATYAKEGFTDLKTRISSDEWVYPTSKTRTVRYSPSRGTITGTGAVNYTFSNGISAVHSANGTSSKFFVDFTELVPTGGVISALKIRVIPGAARATTGDRMQAGYEIAVGDSTITSSPQIYDDGTATAQDLDFGALAITVNHATSRYCAWVYAGADAATHNDFTLYVEVTYSDPGPRNH